MGHNSDFNHYSNFNIKIFQIGAIMITRSFLNEHFDGNSI